MLWNALKFLLKLYLTAVVFVFVLTIIIGQGEAARTEAQATAGGHCVHLSR